MWSSPCFRARSSASPNRNLLSQMYTNALGKLEASRDKLHNEGVRVQREIVQYATFTQAALQSTKIIAESLTQWKKVPIAPTLSD